MSLASILLRSRFPSTIASSPLSSSWAAAVVGGQSLLPQQIRSVWIEVIRQVPSEDPNKAGQLTFEDPDLADARMFRAMRAEAPLRRKPNFSRHEKGWMRRKRLKAQKRYLRLQEGVNELKAYIQFKQDNKPEW
eukprot:CAMPEP_0201865562 /NCGR_PEP_ID=MMETSP0902-20130614/408_1 /ASSEMBLY_ACC=CAM_ASM_000551 /TAXON_ID=420261 /ORGANISM="Thalassiosira antarctica, Strain CCMP982" /LENGTH=133 /DNA_ID=CAMNT_0048390343 /DNA_START=39 /DNA_END=440 /DNA_ORIENTATION=+